MGNFARRFLKMLCALVAPSLRRVAENRPFRLKTVRRLCRGLRKTAEFNERSNGFVDRDARRGSAWTAALKGTRDGLRHRKSGVPQEGDSPIDGRFPSGPRKKPASTAVL